MISNIKNRIVYLVYIYHIHHNHVKDCEKIISFTQQHDTSNDDDDEEEDDGFDCVRETSIFSHTYT